MRNDNLPTHWASLLSRLPELERPAALAMIEGHPSGGVLAGLLSLHVAAGMTYTEAAAQIEAARRDILNATEAARPLREIPRDFAGKIVAAIDVTSLSNGVAKAVAQAAGPAAVIAAGKEAGAAARAAAETIQEWQKLQPLVSAAAIQMRHDHSLMYQAVEKCEIILNRMLDKSNRIEHLMIKRVYNFWIVSLISSGILIALVSGILAWMLRGWIY